MKEKKLVYGVGVNDADYPVTRRAIINNKKIYFVVLSLLHKMVRNAKTLL